ncbi:MAG: hypothetical protein ACYTFK_09900 [Planctomycetota bacterium]|jgi:O-acetyl-ADP-ribose deacetylase (regulator of RNase III)
MQCNINKSILELVQGDITESDTDAIVNAANTQLQLGGNRCAKIMLKTTINYLNDQTNLKKVVFCLYEKPAYDIFDNQLEAEC